MVGGSEEVELNRTQETIVEAIIQELRDAGGRGGEVCTDEDRALALRIFFKLFSPNVVWAFRVLTHSVPQTSLLTKFVAVDKEWEECPPPTRKREYIFRTPTCVYFTCRNGTLSTPEVFRVFGTPPSERWQKLKAPSAREFEKA